LLKQLTDDGSIVCIAAITEACTEVIDAGLLPSLMKLLSTTFDVKKEVCCCIQLVSDTVVDYCEECSCNFTELTVACETGRL